MLRRPALAAIALLGASNLVVPAAQAACGGSNGAAIKTGSVGHATGGITHASAGGGGTTACGLTTRSITLPHATTAVARVAAPAKHATHVARLAAHPGSIIHAAGKARGRRI